MSCRYPFARPATPTSDRVETYFALRFQAANQLTTVAQPGDPVQGDVTVPCIQFSNLTMCIESTGKLVFCKAVPDNFEMTDMLDPGLSGPSIRDIYLNKNREALGGREPFCPAREGFDRKGLAEVPVAWHPRAAIDRTRSL